MTGTFEFNGATIALKDIPEANLVELVRRAYAHILRNEVAAKVVAWEKALGDKVPTAQAKADTIAAYEKLAHEKIMAGDLTTRTRAAKVERDPVAAESIRLALRDIATAAKAKGKAKAIAEMDKSALLNMAQKLVAANAAKYTARAEAIIAQRDVEIDLGNLI